MQPYYVPVEEVVSYTAANNTLSPYVSTQALQN